MKKNLSRNLAIIFIGLVVVVGALSIMDASAAPSASSSLNIGVTVLAHPAPPSAGGTGGGTAPVAANTAYDIDGDGLNEYAVDVNSNPADGYEVFSDSNPVGTVSTLIVSVDYNANGKPEFLIDINSDGKPDKFWDPTAGIVTDIVLSDVDADGTNEYLLDVNGDGVFDYYYDPDTSTLNILTGNSKMADVDGDGLPEKAIDANANPADGYELFTDSTPVGTVSTLIYTVDVNGDGKPEFLIDTNSNGRPDKYWDPNNNVLTNIIESDMNGDGTKDFLLDTNGDGRFDAYYDPATGLVTILPGNIIFKDVDNDTFMERATDVNGNPADGYEIFSDALGTITTVTATVDGNGDGKTDFLLNTGGDPRPDFYWDPVDNILTAIVYEDVDIDGTLEYKVDINGDGIFEKYFDPDTGGQLLALKNKQQTQANIPPEGTWTTPIGQQIITQPNEGDNYPIKFTLEKQTDAAARANGLDTVKITLKAIDKNGKPTSGLIVKLTNDNNNGVTISPEYAATNRDGLAFFQISSKAEQTINLQAQPKDGGVSYVSNTVSVTFKGFAVQPIESFFDRLTSIKINATLKTIAAKIITPLLVIGFIGMILLGILSIFRSLKDFFSIFSILFVKRKKEENYLSYFKKEEEKKDAIKKLKSSIKNISTIGLVLGIVISLLIFWISTSILNGIILAAYLIIFATKYIFIGDTEPYFARVSQSARR